MHYENLAIAQLKKTLSFIEITNFLDKFNNECILYGSCFIKMLNDNVYIKNLYKFNILGTLPYINILNKYFILNNFIKSTKKSKHNPDKTIYMYKYKHDGITYIFKCKIDEHPIKNISKYTNLKIEQIYFDGSLHILYPSNVILKKEVLTLKINDESSFRIIKKISTYIQFHYKFIVYDVNKCYIFSDKSYDKLSNKFKRLYYRFKYKIA